MLQEAYALIDKGDAKAIMRWADDSFSDDADAEFSQSFTTYLLKKNHEQSGGDTNKLMRQLEDFANVYKLFLKGSALKTKFLYQFQHLCASLDFPSGMMDRFVDTSYEAGLLDMESVRVWLRGPESAEKTKAISEISPDFLRDFE